jgi:hypothetical protein
MNGMEPILAIFVGVGLAAACGFRVFVPMLVMSIAARSGHLSLNEHFDWIGSNPAILTFAVATALEIGGYYIPWLDNLLDSIATPAAGVAGTIATAACISDMNPMLTWSLAIIAGGGSAIAVQGLTVVTRGASSLTTGGIGNPVISTAEAGLAFGASTLFIIVPIIAAVCVLGLAFLIIRAIVRRVMRPHPVTPEMIVPLVDEPQAPRA